MNILQAINDPAIFGTFLGANHSTWAPWFAALRALYGLRLPKRQHDLVRQCTGRDPLLMPSSGFDVALWICGRRSGKSRTSSVIGAFEALFGGHEKKLAAGERGVVAIVSPTRDQSRIIFNYLKAIFAAPLLRAEVVAETQSSFDLANGISIEVLTGDHKSVRGRSVVLGIIDEGCFFGLDADAKVKSDVELGRREDFRQQGQGGKPAADTASASHCRRHRRENCLMDTSIKRRRNLILSPHR